MRRPALRWTVLAVAVVVAAGCGYWAAMLERRALDERRSLDTATGDARALQNALSDARRAVAAMAAPGQAAVSWSRQAAASIELARGKLTALSSAEGGAQLRTLTERLDRLSEAQTRLHEAAVGGRAMAASDVAFGEALPHVDAIDQRVGDAVAGMIAAADIRIAASRDRQILAVAGALGAIGIAAVLLTPLPRARTEDAVAVDADDDAAPGADLALQPAQVAPPAPTPVPEARVIEKAKVELTPLAAACEALARVSDGARLPGVLDAVRPTLGARGLAVWLVDGSGDTLQVVASSGYDPRVVERFPALRVADDTPTSQAYARSAPVRTPPRVTQPAAVAVPIAGARGTSGVLSFEMANGRDASTDVVAAATIVAAQLATLLEPAQPADAQVAEPPAVRAEA
ncbi:MAG: GAF domain-containing protein [Vicinamibacterales bacterium]